MDQTEGLTTAGTEGWVARALMGWLEAMLRKEREGGGVEVEEERGRKVSV